MKNMKKFFAVLLTLAMALGMMTTAFAAKPETKTVDISTHTFKAYQIFSADSITADGELGNLAWGSAIEEDAQNAILGAYAVDTLGALVEKLGKMSNDKEITPAILSGDEAGAREFGQLVFDTIDLENATCTDVVSGKTPLPIGYYLIVDTTAGKVDAYNLSILQVSNSKDAVVITSKVEVPTVDKEIMDPTAMKANEAGIGETVNYQITATLPSNFADYDEYYLWFKDDMSKGLTYNNDAKVYVVNGTSEKEVTKYFYIKASKYNDKTGTHIDVKIADLVSLNKLDGVTVNNETKIVVKYSATVNDNAVIVPNANPNKVKLEYSNNPDDDGDGKDTPDEPGDKEPTTDHPTGETPEDEVKTYVTELVLTKIDGKTEEALADAEFTLIGDNISKVIVKTGEEFVVDTEGTYYKLTDGTFTTVAPIENQYEDGKLIVENNLADYDAEALAAGTKYKRVITSTAYTETKDEEGNAIASTIKATTGEDGKITFKGLAAGDYTLVESKTPVGYNTIDDIKFTISFNDGAFAIESGDAEFTGENTFAVTVANNKGTTLPETGGMGTRLFYMIGGLLVVAAGVLLITKRRMATK